MKVSYTHRYYCDIGEGHRFPITKYSRVLDRLLADGTLRDGDVVEPDPSSTEDLLLVHTEDYVSRLTRGELTPREVRRLGFPWSPEMVERSRFVPRPRGTARWRRDDRRPSPAGARAPRTAGDGRRAHRWHRAPRASCGAAGAPCSAPVRAAGPAKCAGFGRSKWASKSNELWSASISPD